MVQEKEIYLISLASIDAELQRKALSSCIYINIFTVTIQNNLCACDCSQFDVLLLGTKIKKIIGSIE